MEYSIKLEDTQKSTSISETNSIDLIDDQEFDKIERIGKSNNILCRCHHIKYNKPYAMKIFLFDDLNVSQNFLNEARFSDLSHPNIIEIRGLNEEVLIEQEFIMKKASYIVMELAKADFDQLIFKKIFLNDETLVRTFFRQMVEGVKYIHSQKISHMDLKPNNLVLGYDNQLKIIDFDLAMKQGEDYLPGFGTANFRAPELLRKNVTDPTKCDIFSIAIILFVFMFGKTPYREDMSKGDAYWLNRQTDAFFEKLGVSVSGAFKKLFRAMTCEDPQARWSLEEVEASDWYNDRVYNDEELASCLKERL